MYVHIIHIHAAAYIFYAYIQLCVKAGTTGGTFEKACLFKLPPSWVLTAPMEKSPSPPCLQFTNT